MANVVLIAALCGHRPLATSRRYVGWVPEGGEVVELLYAASLRSRPMSDASGEWRPDPALPGRQRYWNGSKWTSHVTDNDGTTYSEAWLGDRHVRWQYGIVNIGMFGALERMQGVFGHLGQHGWELVTVYDKSSNWFADMEKGFMLFKRPVPAGERLDDDEWCIALSLT